MLYYHTNMIVYVTNKIWIWKPMQKCWTKSSDQMLFLKSRKNTVFGPGRWTVEYPFTHAALLDGSWEFAYPLYITFGLCTLRKLMAIVKSLCDTHPIN